MTTNAQPAPGAQALSLGSKTHSATCQNGGSNHPHTQTKDGEWKEISFSPQAEKG